MTDPLQVYTARLAARRREFDRLARLDARLASARLTAVGLLILAAILSLRTGWLSPWWMVTPVLAFVALAVWHDRVLRSKHCAAVACSFYEHGLARLEDRWMGMGSPGNRYIDESHPYANDLDLFGPASLFELLSLARTQIGEQTLAAWMKAPALASDIVLRQQAVAELRPHLDFRESLATAGSDSAGLDTEALEAWLGRALPPISISIQVMAVALAIAVVATIWWWIAGGPLAPMVVALLLKATFARLLQARVSQVLKGVEEPIRQLDTLSGALVQIEQLTVTTARLTTLRHALQSQDGLPSRAIKRLDRLVEMLEWPRNVLFAPIAAAVSWSTHIAAAILRWRQIYGTAVPEWLTTLGEYEALNALAAYSYEHPDDPFPSFVEAGDAALEGRQLGHPLVARAQMVKNDVLLSHPVRLLVVSGSNMSGKSTLLRTVGINVVMALAGAPVRAASLALTPLAVGATLHIQDSLQAGRSRFFTEITRVRQIADLAGRQPPLLFLLDELFQGTNSDDRKVGASAVLRTLVNRGAIGLITTHDLALTAIADELGGRAANVHFRDEFREGEMVFDYKMHPGPVTHSNALSLMRAVGLSVADGEPASDKTDHE